MTQEATDRHSGPLDRLAFAISAAASPFITISVCAAGVIATRSRSPRDIVVFGGAFLALIIVLPAIWIVAGVRRGSLTDVHVMVREQRHIPFAVATIGACVLVAVYLALGAPVALTVLAVNLVANGIVLAVVTLIWKVSVHAAAYAASVVVAAALIDPRLGVLAAGLPAVILARVRRKRHSVPQAVVAALIVASITWFVCRSQIP